MEQKKALKMHQQYLGWCCKLSCQLAVFATVWHLAEHLGEQCLWLCWEWWRGDIYCSLATGLQARQRMEQKKTKVEPVPLTGWDEMWKHFQTKKVSKRFSNEGVEFSPQVGFKLSWTAQLGIIWECGRFMLPCFATIALWGHPSFIKGRLRVFHALVWMALLLKPGP